MFRITQKHEVESVDKRGRDYPAETITTELALEPPTFLLSGNTI